MEKILIELILTNKCNKRCEYCDLLFTNNSLSFNELDLFIKFLENNKAEYNINFFWWEPLLEFDKIKYFVEKSRNYITKYSIWTNWVLLDNEKLEFFKNNNILIYLSVDNIKIWNDLNFELLSKYSDIININFINDPDFLFNSVSTFEKIIKFWFKNIAFMPVLSTKKWTNKHLWDFKKIYEYILKNSENINLSKYSYFNWVAIDKQFILDTDLNFYSDLDSLLWLQKQYKNVNNELKIEINKKTKLLSLNSLNLSLKNLINLYNVDDILMLVFEIPKINWDLLSYKVIDKILKNGTKQR